MAQQGGSDIPIPVFKVKQEPSVPSAASQDASKSAARPKFTPKAPPRRQLKAETDGSVKSEAGPPQSAPKPRANRRYEDGGRGGGGRGRGRGGRTPFEAPRGETFFSGSATNQTSNALQRAAAVKAQLDRKQQEASGSSADVRIKPDPDEPLTGGSSASSALTPMDIGGDQQVIPEEHWPPVDFDPNAPVSLPFGPKDPRTKARLAAQPTFASAHDAGALAKEEEEDVLLLQFPFMLPTPVQIQKDHRFVPPGGATKQDGTADEDPSIGATPEDDSFTVTPDMLSLHRYPEGKLGKMQVMSDGSMRLWIGSSCYEVHKSLHTYFEQELACIDAESRVQDPAAAPTGSLTFLGQVTKKVVVTPQVQY